VFREFCSKSSVRSSQLRKYAVCLLKIERSIEDKVSERNVEWMVEGKVVNCVGLKLEKSVRGKCSVKPEREQSINQVSSYS
jgi:hypothetical protein